MAVIGLGCAKEAPQTPEALAKWSDESLWSLEVIDIDGNKRSLSEFDGKVALVVNVASRCGFTPQYEELQSLYDSRRSEGFVILGFPCNDFGSQESGSLGEIKTFCTTRFGVEFPMFSKVEIKDEATRKEDSVRDRRSTRFQELRQELQLELTRFLPASGPHQL